MQNENVKSLVQKVGENSDPGVQRGSQAALPEAASVLGFPPTSLSAPFQSALLVDFLFLFIPCSHLLVYLLSLPPI